MERKEQVRQGQPGSVQRQRQSKRLVTIKTHITYHLTIENNNHCNPCDERQYSQFLQCFFRDHAVVSHSLRSYHNMSPPDLWKWKWSNGVGKSEMSIIWCISITNNVKSNKKFNETAQTANFTDFPLILCGNGPKATKTTQTQTLFSQIGTFFWGIQGIPSESWRPGLSENVVVFVAIIF